MNRRICRYIPFFVGRAARLIFADLPEVPKGEQGPWWKRRMEEMRKKGEKPEKKPQEAAKEKKEEKAAEVVATKREEVKEVGEEVLNKKIADKWKEELKDAQVEKDPFRGLGKNKEAYVLYRLIGARWKSRGAMDACLKDGGPDLEKIKQFLVNHQSEAKGKLGFYFDGEQFLAVDKRGSDDEMGTADFLRAYEGSEVEGAGLRHELTVDVSDSGLKSEYAGNLVKDIDRFVLEYELLRGGAMEGEAEVLKGLVQKSEDIVKYIVDHQGSWVTLRPEDVEKSAGLFVDKSGAYKYMAVGDKICAMRLDQADESAGKKLYVIDIRQRPKVTEKGAQVLNAKNIVWRLDNWKEVPDDQIDAELMKAAESLPEQVKRSLVLAAVPAAAAGAPAEEPEARILALTEKIGFEFRKDRYEISDAGEQALKNELKKSISLALEKNYGALLNLKTPEGKLDPMKFKQTYRVDVDVAVDKRATDLAGRVKDAILKLHPEMTTVEGEKVFKVSINDKFEVAIDVADPSFKTRLEEAKKKAKDISAQAIDKIKEDADALQSTILGGFIFNFLCDKNPEKFQKAVSGEGFAGFLLGIFGIGAGKKIYKNIGERKEVKTFIDRAKEFLAKASFGMIDLRFKPIKRDGLNKLVKEGVEFDHDVKLAEAVKLEHDVKVSVLTAGADFSIETEGKTMKLEDGRTYKDLVLKAGTALPEGTIFAHGTVGVKPGKKEGEKMEEPLPPPAPRV